ncbi:fructokinase [Massilia arenosa]|uniref:Fructokinase n=1 Tax=Zemynaea arenosa TaxID=2561931 RepID=A0A4Y9S0G7_9BURK|nr:PfkB family carbohydrate kinase [Massilia arenosa]TFW14997.1 fructokinase [Massilia arenosa]
MSAVVFGEALVDDFSTEQVVGGAPFNVARHLAAFMANPLAITRIGDDRNGAMVLAEFERFAMSRRGLQIDPMEETGRVIVERGPNGHRFVILPRQAWDFIDPQVAEEVAREAAPSLLYFGSLAQRGERSAEALRRVLDAVAVPRFLDLNLRAGQVGEEIVTHSLQSAHVAKVNEEELQELLKWYLAIEPETTLDSNEVRAACAELVQRFSLDALIVTLGHRGSAHFAHGGEVIATRDVPAPPYVIDTVGAGDAFAAIYLLGRERGWEMEETLFRANEFAGAVCAIPGAVPRDLSFYDRWAARWKL